MGWQSLLHGKMNLDLSVSPLQELERMGILRTDPRLAPIIETLNMIKRKTFGAIYGIDNIKLDFNQFQK